MPNYEIPTSEDLTPDEAGAALEKVHADVAQDTGHPYLDEHHLLHRKFVEGVHGLHLVHTQREGGELSSVEKVMEEALDEKGVKQNELVGKAQAEMDKLVELGFEDDPVPDDIREFQLTGLKMQRLAAEGDFEALTPIIGEQLRGLRQTAEIQQCFQTFVELKDLDAGVKTDITERLIRYIHDSNKQIHSKGT